MAKILPEKNAVLPSSATNWTTDLGGSLSWTASGGTPTSGSGTPFIWGAPASGTIRITVTNGSLTAIRDVLVVTYSLSQEPSLAVEGSVDDVTLFHRMENGARRGRQKIPPKAAWELTFKNRVQADYDAVISLFALVGKLQPFFMNDPITGLGNAWYFDSAITRRYGGRGCSIDYSFRVLEA